MIGKRRALKSDGQVYEIRDAVETWANPAVYGGSLLERFYSRVLISSRSAREAHDRLARGWEPGGGGRGGNGENGIEFTLHLGTMSTPSTHFACK